MKLLYSILILLLCLSSCKKDVVFCTSGYIYYGGDYAIDGLGWYFAKERAGEWKFYQLKENELPAAYKIAYTDSVAVQICLVKTLEQAPCFCASPSYFYTIRSIKKR